jgi:hypothetical protein
MSKINIEIDSKSKSYKITKDGKDVTAMPGFKNLELNIGKYDHYMDVDDTPTQASSVYMRHRYMNDGEEQVHTLAFNKLTSVNKMEDIAASQIFQENNSLSDIIKKAF